MKILHVTPYFSPAWAYGGTPRAVYEIARRQAKLGHSVTVLTTDALEKNQRLVSGEASVAGVRVFRVKNLSNFLMWNLHFCTPKLLPKSLDISKFDVVHLHETRTLLNYLVLRKVVKKQMLVLSPWGTLSYNRQLALPKKILDVFLLSSLRNIDLFLGQNNHELKVASSFSIGRKRQLLPLGIDLSFFKHLPDKRILRKRLKIDDNIFLALFLGRFSKAKGLDLLINSFAKFSQGKIRTRLLLVGRDDGFLNVVQNMIKGLGIKDKVIICGPLYDRNRLKAYAAADVFIYTPTAFEETSTACLEALASGVPVVTTRQAEIPYLNRDDGVWQVGDLEREVIRAMEELYNSRKIEVSSAKLKNLFDWDVVVKSIDSILKR